MAIYVCRECGYVYDDAKEAKPFAELPDSWTCPVCGAPKSCYLVQVAGTAFGAPAAAGGVSDKTHDDLEEWMADIRLMAETGV